MISIQIWPGSDGSKVSASFLEKAHELKMPKTRAYRMDDASLLICLPYGKEKTESFEALLQNEKFGEVPVGEAGSLKKPHYTKKIIETWDSASTRTPFFLL